jgi:hypothetical protein
MKKFILILLILFCIEANAQIDKSGVKNCEIPNQSQWNDSLESLVKKTKNIFVGELVSSSDGGEKFDIKTDMKIKSSFAADGKRDASGRRQTYFYNEIWKSKLWTFKVSEVLKGEMQQGSEVSFTSLGWTKKPDSQQLSYMCDLILGFENGKKYVIFLNSFSPLGYKMVSAEKDPHLLKVKNLIQK